MRQLDAIQLNGTTELLVERAGQQITIQIIKGKMLYFTNFEIVPLPQTPIDQARLFGDVGGRSGALKVRMPSRAPYIVSSMLSICVLLKYRLCNRVDSVRSEYYAQDHHEQQCDVVHPGISNTSHFYVFAVNQYEKHDANHR